VIVVKNDYQIKDNYVEIYLKRRSGEIITTKIDADDLKKLQEVNNTWFSHWNEYTQSYYVYGNIPGTKKKIRLHRFLFDDPEGLVIDHINHDTLDNRRTNLRAITRLGNTQNKKGENKNNKSGVRGVCWNKNAGKWKAHIRVKGKQTHLGYFVDLEEAEKAVIKARKEKMEYYP
jgi:hypothetical protein